MNFKTNKSYLFLKEVKDLIAKYELQIIKTWDKEFQDFIDIWKRIWALEFQKFDNRMFPKEAEDES